jgi:hypothetical protein
MKRDEHPFKPKKLSVTFLYPGGYRNGTESFFGLKRRPSVVRDAEIHNQPVMRMRRK